MEVLQELGSTLQLWWLDWNSCGMLNAMLYNLNIYLFCGVRHSWQRTELIVRSWSWSWVVTPEHEVCVVSARGRFSRMNEYLALSSLGLRIAAEL